MSTKKFNSYCIICKQPANAPEGFSNVHKVTLCASKKCRRIRKSELQRARRKQAIMAFAKKSRIGKKKSLEMLKSAVSKHNSMPKSKAARRERQIKFESGSIK